MAALSPEVPHLSYRAIRTRARRKHTAEASTLRVKDEPQLQFL